MSSTTRDPFEKGSLDPLKLLLEGLGMYNQDGIEMIILGTVEDEFDVAFFDISELKPFEVPGFDDLVFDFRFSSWEEGRFQTV